MNESNLDLEAIQKRAEAATMGDWDYDAEDYGISNGNFMVAMADVSEKGHPFINAKDVDIKFIAHAREDVPALIAEVERLLRLNEKYYGILTKLGYGIEE
ncbi:hypothetical protein ACNA6I_01180 [Rossellomorea sp. FS2]|uniref:hypothetical protein n=1 Tax=Rossellomorea sp. FS2 TaxID=3391447 RepID=UPI003A4E34E7